MFIVFEGGEGSGKTQHAKRVAAMLEGLGHHVYTTHEPGGTSLGKDIRNLILNRDIEVAPVAELYLFLADRAQHVAAEIQPRLEKKEFVICDRFTGSTLAYQLGGRGLTHDSIIVQAEALSRNFLEPDLVVYLDVDPEIGLARKQQQGSEHITKFEESTLSFHHLIRTYFQKLVAERSNWVQLDASRTLDEVESDIEEQIVRLLTKRNFA